MCSDEVAYGRGTKSRENLEYEVKEHIYPPAILFAVQYNSPPDCSRGAMKTRLYIEGTNKDPISFRIKVYELKSK